MADISWDKLNYKFSLAVVAICLINIGTYIVKGDDSCFFKLQSLGDSGLRIHIDTKLILFIATLFYVYTYYSVSVIKNVNSTRNKQVYLFCASFLLAFFFILLSEYIKEFSLLLWLFATASFSASLYSIIKILSIDGLLKDKNLIIWAVATIIIIAVCICIEVSAGPSCWK